MHRLRGLRAGVPGRGDQARYRARVGEAAEAQCRFCEGLAKHHPEERAPCRCQDLGGGFEQAENAFLSQSRNRGLIAPLTRRDENVMLRSLELGFCSAAKL